MTQYPAAAGPAEGAHALCVRLSDGASAAEVERRLAEALGALCPPTALWAEEVAAPSDSAPARRRRAREVSRPIAVEAAPVRAVLLSYPAGERDLALTARRSVLDATSLLALAHAAAGGAAPEPAGAGNQNYDTLEVELCDGGDASALAAAVGIAWAVHDDGEALEVPVWTEAPDRPDGVLGAFAAATTRHRSPVGVLADSSVPQDLPWPATVQLHGGKALIHHRSEPGAGRLARHIAVAYAQLRAEAEIDLVGDDERSELSRLGLPEHEVPPWPYQRIDAAFEARAATHPDAIALSCAQDRLTYGELNARADQAAAGLIALGVGPGDLVGVCLERSLDLVPTLLGVLKADAVYVPMDSAYPEDRLAYTVQDAGMALVVTALDSFPRRSAAKVVTPDEVAAAGEPGLPAKRAASLRAGGGAAYVIYTSGSTGRPKGVVVPHHNVTALLAATAADFGLGPEDVWTLFHSAAFDFSVWEMWGPLLTGGRLVVVPYWAARSPEDFHALLLREGVTVLNQTPSAFAQLVEADRRLGVDLAVRLVVFGGEPLDQRALLPWMDRYPEDRCRLVNMFGITETTVHVTAQTVTRRGAVAGSRSVGRPLPGWRVRILDERGRPVPLGASGEICVGGAGVALGYLGRPGLTAERFVPDDGYGGRMYRSGDLGRMLPDGRIEHLGRLDGQVKIRGFRIELDEIRIALLQQSGVTAAAVVVRRAREGDAATDRLDAYVVPAPGRGAAEWVGSLRERVARLLPDYMVPATVTAVPELPLTANGKLDAARLPAPASPATRAAARPALSGAAGPAGVSVAAGSAPSVESVDAGLAEVVEAWAAVLGVAVGPDDDFFALGGNSLAAVRIRTELRARGVAVVGVRDVYRHPTARRLAAHLADAAAPAAEPAVPSAPRPPAPSSR